MIKSLTPNSRLLLLLCSLFATVNLQAQNEMSLQQAIDFALANNNEIKEAQLSILDSEAMVRERKSIGLPQLNASASFQHYLQVPAQPLPEAFVDFLEQANPGEPVSREASFVLKNNITTQLNLDAMLFDGVYFIGLEAAKAAKDASQLEFLTVQRTVRQSVRDAYLPVLLINANMEQLDKNIANLEKLLFETEEIYKAGFAEQLDVDRLALSLANLTVEKEHLLRQKEIVLRALKFTINYPLENELDINDDLAMLLEGNNEAILTTDVSYDRRPEMALLKQTEHLNELNVRVNKTAYLPNLRAFGALQYQYQGDNFSDGFWAPTAYLGLRLSIPIYDGSHKRALVQRAQIGLQKARLQQSTYTRAIDLEVNNAKDNYANANERLVDRQNNLDLAQRIYDTTQIKYREGVGSSLEVSQAEQSLFMAQTNLIQAQYDLLIAKIDLSEALGLD